MTALLGVLVLSSCMGDIAPGLQDVYCRAVDAWAPYRAEVRRVKWCEPGECAGMGGGMFSYDSRVIAIDPDWPFTGNELLLTLEHEYGHALGLQHRWGNSIMKPGWDPPFADGPTEEDFGELQRMRDVGARHPEFKSGKDGSKRCENNRQEDPIQRLTWCFNALGCSPTKTESEGSYSDDCLPTPLRTAIQ